MSAAGLPCKQQYDHEDNAAIMRCVINDWLRNEQTMLARLQMRCCHLPLDSNILGRSSYAAQYRRFLLKSAFFQLCWQMHSVIQQRLERGDIPAQTNTNSVAYTFSFTDVYMLHTRSSPW